MKRRGWGWRLLTFCFQWAWWPCLNWSAVLHPLAMLWGDRMYLFWIGDKHCYSIMHWWRSIGRFFQPSLYLIFLWYTEVAPLQETLLFQSSDMRTPLHIVEPLYRGHLCIQWNPTFWNEDTSVYSGTLYSNPWNEDTSVYSGTPLFQPPEMRTPLYTVEPLYSNLLKWGHLCIQWNPSIPTSWNEDTSVYSGTPLFQPWNEDTPYTLCLKSGHFNLSQGIQKVPSRMERFHCIHKVSEDARHYKNILVKVNAKTTTLWNLSPCQGKCKYTVRGDIHWNLKDMVPHDFN